MNGYQNKSHLEDNDSAGAREEFPPSSSSLLIPSLVEFGLTQLQEKIFVSIVGTGGMSTTEISKVASIHRSDVYRALQKLVKVGLVEANVGNPTRYYATEPTEAVRLLVELKRKELLLLESRTDNITEWLERERNRAKSFSLPSKESEDQDEPATFRLVKGNAVTQRIIQSIQSAHNEIIKVVSAQALRRHYFEFSEFEREAFSRNVTVRILTEIVPQNLRVASNYSKYVHLRHVANLDRSLRYLVIDAAELVLAGTVEYKDELDRSILTTKNSVLVRGCESYFEDMWSKSISARDRLYLIQNSANNKK
jgi:sugar-specific transcriptional regulator TrmB